MLCRLLQSSFLWSLLFCHTDASTFSPSVSLSPALTHKHAWHFVLLLKQLLRSLVNPPWWSEKYPLAYPSIETFECLCHHRISISRISQVSSIVPLLFCCPPHCCPSGLLARHALVLPISPHRLIPLARCSPALPLTPLLSRLGAAGSRFPRGLFLHFLCGFCAFSLPPENASDPQPTAFCIHATCYRATVLLECCSCRWDPFYWRNARFPPRPTLSLHLPDVEPIPSQCNCLSWSAHSL